MIPDIMNNTTFSRLHHVAAELVDTPGFPIILILEMIVSLAAILPNLLLLYVLARVRIFPMNLRLLLGHLSLNLIAYATAFWVKAISTLTVVIERRNPDLLIANSYMCKFTELANTVPLQNVVYSSLALCLERIYSTIRYKKYEREHSKPWLAIAFIPLVWATSLANQLNSLFTIDRSDEVPICESLLSVTPKAAMLILTLNLSVESTNVLLAGIVYFWNSRKLRAMTMNRAQTSLGARFQISQNVEINSIMMPSMVLQSICYVPNYIFLFLVIFGLDEEHFQVPLRAILIHVNYFWKLCFCLLHPLVAFNRKARLMHHLKKRAPTGLGRILNRSHRINPTMISTTMAAAEMNIEDTIANTNAHFEALKSIWAAQASYNSRNKYTTHKLSQ